MEGRTDGDGFVSAEVPVAVVGATLWAWLEGDNGAVHAFPLAIRHLDPIDERHAPECSAPTAANEPERIRARGGHFARLRGDAGDDWGREAGTAQPAPVVVHRLARESAAWGSSSSSDIERIRRSA